MTKVTINSLLFVVVLLLVGACYRDYDYEYLSFADSMHIVEYGQTTLENVRDHGDIPTAYRLERDEYSLHAEVDRSSSYPAIVFSVESDIPDRVVHLVGTSIRCFALFERVIEAEVRVLGFPESGIRFIWAPTRHGSCSNAVFPTGHDRELELSVYVENGELIAVETLRFEVKSNGIYREMHSL